MKIYSTKIGKYSFEVFSQETKKSIKVQVNIKKNSSDIIFENQTAINLSKNQGQIKIINWKNIEFEEIKINSINSNISLFVTEHEINYLSHIPGKYEINLQYKNKNYNLTIYTFENFKEVTKDLKINNKIEFLKSEFNVVNYSKNLTLKTEKENYVFKFNTKSLFNAKIELFSNKGEKVILNLINNNESQEEQQNCTSNCENNPELKQEIN
ncbi:hypothetical protein [Spiroplasma taiwanense]|uniref:Uncharacterized protein n=1 Tax=Spiroplasma taiwanense CT-1 TaxID=1276220 RepID=S5M0K1_9MOLU|nr:hypothetical protein [Spiroplasma taiwanense]AGR41527.1 hypothetical protein STAIW_v1c09410 [Spiroplasma taiwanense CT-1]